MVQSKIRIKNYTQQATFNFIEYHEKQQDDNRLILGLIREIIIEMKMEELDDKTGEAFIGN